MGAYDLIEVVIGGEKIQARPVGWADEVPIKFQTTCPKCSQLIEFDGHDFVCTACGTPGVVMVSPSPANVAVAVFPDLKNVGMIEQKIPKGAILDPIDENIFPKELLDLQFLERLP